MEDVVVESNVFVEIIRDRADSEGVEEE